MAPGTLNQLRTAPAIEDDSLAALKELAAAARSADVTKLFRHHQDETKEQIQNLHRVFTLTEPCVSTNMREPVSWRVNCDKSSGHMARRSQIGRNDYPGTLNRSRGLTS